MHAMGVLSRSRDHAAIPHIVNAHLYLSPQHRDTRDNPTGAGRVIIAESHQGARLTIDNTYAWLATAYLRDYFLALCDATQAVLASRTRFAWSYQCLRAHPHQGPLQGAAMP